MLLAPLDLVENGQSSGCPTPGCKGIGHIKGAKYTGHHSAFGCPYSDLNMNKIHLGLGLQDRLGPGREMAIDAKSGESAQSNAEIKYSKL